MSWSRRRKWIAGAAAFVAVAVAATCAVHVAASARVSELLRVEISERYGVEAGVEDVSLSLLDGTVVLTGVRVVDGAVVVLEVERVEIDARLADLAAGRCDFTALRIVRPVLHVVVEADGRTNVGRLLASTGGDSTVIVRHAEAVDGRIDFDDPVTDPDRPLRLVVSDVRVVVDEWQLSGDADTRSSADLRVDCELEQPGFPARVSVVGWSRPPGEVSATSLHAAVTGLDLRRIPQYVSAVQRAAIGGELIHLVVDVQAHDGVIEPGALVCEVPGPGTVLPVRVGGTTSDPVFDIESPLATLLEIPLSRAGRFGAVAADAGWSAMQTGASAASAVGSGAADAGADLGDGFAGAYDDVRTGDPLGALAQAGEGLADAAGSMAGGLVSGAGRLLGLGAADAPASVDDAAVLDREFAVLHAARRSAMLRAALASVAADVCPERRDRIAAEIARSSAPSVPAVPPPVAR